jgi:hypothetical protein
VKSSTLHTYVVILQFKLRLKKSLIMTYGFIRYKVRHEN